MDTELLRRVALARFHQLPPEFGQSAHRFDVLGVSVTVTHIQYEAKARTLKTKPVSLRPCNLDNVILPSNAQAIDGGSLYYAVEDNPSKSWLIEPELSKKFKQI